MLIGSWTKLTLVGSLFFSLLVASASAVGDELSNESLNAESLADMVAVRLVECAPLVPDTGYYVFYESKEAEAALSAYRNCIGEYIGYEVVNGRVKPKFCMFSGLFGKGEQCNDYNNGLYIIRKVDATLGRRNKYYLNKGHFKGSKCTIDCSGHRAGYAWAEYNRIEDERRCSSFSDSFKKGCLIFLKEG